MNSNYLVRWARFGTLYEISDEEVNSVRDPSGRTLLIVAAMHGQTETCDLLIKRGAHLEATCKDGATALSYASIFGNAKTCALLLEKGSKVTATDCRGENCIVRAAASGAPLESMMLLCKAAPVLLNSTDCRGKTVLMLLAERGHAHAIRELASGFYVAIDARTPSGLTALHFAAMNSQTSACRALLELGASTHLRGGLEDLKAHEIAERNGLHALAEDMRKKDLELIASEIRRKAAAGDEPGSSASDQTRPGSEPNPEPFCAIS